MTFLRILGNCYGHYNAIGGQNIFNSTAFNERDTISLFKFSCRRGKIFRVRALCLSYLRVLTSKREGRNNKNTADVRVVVISPRKAKAEVTTIVITLTFAFRCEILTTRKSAVFSLFRPLRFEAKTRQTNGADT
jgi:hypothetical protein